MASRISEQLGNYRLTQLLGSGSFAEVYLGEHVLIPLKVAIKILHTKVAAEYRETFLKEAEALVQEHPTELVKRPQLFIKDVSQIQPPSMMQASMMQAPIRPATIQMTNPYEKDRNEEGGKKKKTVIIVLVMLLLSIMITYGVFVGRNPTASPVSTSTGNVQSSPITTTQPGNQNSQGSQGGQNSQGS